MRSLPRNYLLLLLLLFSVLLAGAGLYMKTEIAKRTVLQGEHDTLVAAQVEGNRVYTDIVTRMRVAEGIGEWESLDATIGALPEEDQETLRLTVDAKLLEARFWGQEEFLSAVRALLEVNENDLAAGEYLKEAEEINTANMKIIAGISEKPGDCPWNAELNYLKGAIYYRALAFVPGNENAQGRELIAKALEHFKKVFDCYRKDRDTEVAIELLHKQAKNFASPGSSGNRRLQVMPAPLSSGRDSPGTGRSDRERGI